MYGNGVNQGMCTLSPHIYLTSEGHDGVYIRTRRSAIRKTPAFVTSLFILSLCLANVR
jgi:hypothetical protein